MKDTILVSEITSPSEKTAVSRDILEVLPDWFGIPEAREEYIKNSAKEIFFAALEGKVPVGFLTLKRTGEATAELSVMGVRKEHHRQGIGRALFRAARARAGELGYSFLQVKTVQMGRYPEYDATNRFYLSLGFREFEVFPTLWDEWNPCQIYIMYIGGKDDLDTEDEGRTLWTNRTSTPSGTITTAVPSGSGNAWSKNPLNLS